MKSSTGYTGRRREDEGTELGAEQEHGRNVGVQSLGSLCALRLGEKTRGRLSFHLFIFMFEIVFT